MTTLVFVDTNVLLDYYRAEGNDDLSILSRFANNKDRIITTTQVEMEYKKNRQSAILRASESISQPQNSIVVPSFLRESQLTQSINKTQTELKKHAKELKEKTTKLLSDPILNDPVYKALQPFFNSKAPCHFRLDLDAPIKEEIEQKAYRRFLMGYPPRKDKDTSMGDSINWEWLIHCADKFASNVIIVSRDGDYGLRYGSDVILNDWLQQEFKERIKDKYQLTLTTKLTEAFKLASIRVTKQQELSEEQMLNSIKADFLAAFRNNINPPVGARDVSLCPVFTWPGTNGTISYDFVIAEDFGHVNKFAIIDYGATTSRNSIGCKETLKPNTTYWWQVRAVGPTKLVGAWTSYFFTTGPN